MTTQPLAPGLQPVLERIHVLMFRHKVTQRQLAAALGITQPSVARKLRGAVPITIPELLTIAQALGVSAGELLDGEPTLDQVVRHQGLEPRTRWFEVPPRSARRHLRVVA